MEHEIHQSKNVNRISQQHQQQQEQKQQKHQHQKQQQQRSNNAIQTSSTALHQTKNIRPMKTLISTTVTDSLSYLGPFNFRQLLRPIQGPTNSLRKRKNY